MCVVSMVSDHFNRTFDPYIRPQQPPVTFVQLAPDLTELHRLLDDFRAAMAAARLVDRLTGQPDCVDPEKAKLEARVAELEKQLAAVRAAATAGAP